MSVKFSRKGLSPLIAAVLLIAFTMTVAAILATWAQSFGGGELETAGEKGQTTIECFGISIEIDSITWDKDKDEIKAVVWNKGEGNISSFEFVVYNKTNSSTPNILTPENFNKTIAPGKFVTLTADGVSEEPSSLKIRVFPGRCPKYNPLRTCSYSNGGFDC